MAHGCAGHVGGGRRRQHRSFSMATRAPGGGGPGDAAEPTSAPGCRPTARRSLLPRTPSRGAGWAPRRGGRGSFQVQGGPAVAGAPWGSGSCPARLPGEPACSRREWEDGCTASGVRLAGPGEVVSCARHRRVRGTGRAPTWPGGQQAPRESPRGAVGGGVPGAHCRPQACPLRRQLPRAGDALRAGPEVKFEAMMAQREGW